MKNRILAILIILGIIFSATVIAKISTHENYMRDSLGNKFVVGDYLKSTESIQDVDIFCSAIENDVATFVGARDFSGLGFKVNQDSLKKSKWVVVRLETP